MVILRCWRSVGAFVLLSGLVCSQDPSPQVDFDSAAQSASQTIQVQVDVDVSDLPDSSDPQMRFLVTWPGGGCESVFEPVGTGLNQTFTVLFPCEIPAGAEIHAEVIWDPSGAWHGDDFPIS